MDRFKNMSSFSADEVSLNLPESFVQSGLKRESFILLKEEVEEAI